MVYEGLVAVVVEPRRPSAHDLRKIELPGGSGAVCRSKASILRRLHEPILAERGSRMRPPKSAEHPSQVDYFITVRGATKICAYDDRPDSQTKGQLDEIISSGEQVQCVRIPGFYYHGFKSVGYEPALVVYLTTKLYDYKNPDEERRPWNDQTIINPRTSKPFDWNAIPHK